MSRNNSIDYIIRGEGEETSIKLVNAINNGENLNKIPNIVYRENGKLIVTETKESIIDLDKYTPAYDIIQDWELYRAPTNNEITTTVQFSRGCNHRCNFCGQWMFWHNWHSKSIDKFIDEIKMLNKKYGVTFFIWADENPAQYQDTWINLLQSMKEINKNNTFHHMLDTRVDHIIRDENYLDLYKEAGIFSIYLRMESVSQQNLDYFNKETTIEMNKKTLELLRKNNIVSIVQLLIGLPDENKESMLQNKVLLTEWEPDLAHFYFLTPLPWTEFGKSMSDKIVEHNWEKWDYRNPIVRLNNLSPEELIKMSKKIKLVFNFNPKVANALSIEDTYRRNFVINSLIQSLKQRSGQNENSDLQ